jgi:hypothetical protein
VAAAAAPPAPDPKPNAKKAPAPAVPEGPPPYSLTPASKLSVRGPFTEENAEIPRLVLAVVRHEGPVHEEVVARRVATAFETRMSEKLRGAVARAVAQVVAEDLAAVCGGFLWPAGKTECPLRGPPKDGDVRAIEHVPEEEIASGLRTILATDLRLPREALVKEVARLLGLKRPSEAALVRVDSVLGALVALGEFADTEGTITLAP